MGTRKMYYLTDGITVEKTRKMTKKEYRAAENKVWEATDGNWHWVLYVPNTNTEAK